MNGNETSNLIDTFLRLKAKAAAGVAWSSEEQQMIDSALERADPIGVLAACCILASKVPSGSQQPLNTIIGSLESRLPGYVELSVYEALIMVDDNRLRSFANKLIPFIERTLNERAINLDNTITLIGKLARSREKSCLELLRGLTLDSETGVREIASAILKDLEQDNH